MFSNGIFDVCRIRFLDRHCHCQSVVRNRTDEWSPTGPFPSFLGVWKSIERTFSEHRMAKCCRILLFVPFLNDVLNTLLKSSRQVWLGKRSAVQQIWRLLYWMNRLKVTNGRFLLLLSSHRCSGQLLYKFVVLKGLFLAVGPVCILVPCLMRTLYGMPGLSRGYKCQDNSFCSSGWCFYFQSRSQSHGPERSFKPY